MTRCGVVRWSVPAVLVLVLAGCGGSGEGESADPASPESAESSESSESSGGVEPGADADGECGAGAVPTKVIKGAEGVQLTVPKDWKVRSSPERNEFQVWFGDRDMGGGFLDIDQADQTLDQAVTDVEELNSFARLSHEADLSLDGLDGGKLLIFTDDDGAIISNVVGVTSDGLRAVVNMLHEAPAPKQAITESCLSTLRRVQ